MLVVIENVELIELQVSKTLNYNRGDRIYRSYHLSQIKAINKRYKIVPTIAKDVETFRV